MHVCRLRPVLALVAALWPAIASAQQGGGDAPPPTVEVIETEARDVTLTALLPGRVSAAEEAEVRPQVGGIITERLFREGARVDAGDVLYRIDPAIYEAALAEAEAQIAQAQAQVTSAEKEAARLQELSDRNVASQQSLDDAVAARDSAEASLQLARAQRQRAEIELDRTEITARLSGEIGLSMTSPGALVAVGQADALAIIRSIDTVNVDVTQSAADILAWRQGRALSDLGASEKTVKLTLADGSLYSETGTLTAAEPYVDPQTGVVVLRITFDNPDELLLPGMYVQVEMPTRVVENVIVLPQEGVTRSRRGEPQAMVVNDEDAIEVRNLEILQNVGSDWVVQSGLEAGERVVVAGFQRIQEGATVTPRPADRADGNDAAGATGQGQQQTTASGGETAEGGDGSE